MALLGAKARAKSCCRKSGSVKTRVRGHSWLWAMAASTPAACFCASMSASSVGPPFEPARQVLSLADCTRLAGEQELRQGEVQVELISRGGPCSAYLGKFFGDSTGQERELHGQGPSVLAVGADQQ